MVSEIHLLWLDKLQERARKVGLAGDSVIVASFGIRARTIRPLLSIGMCISLYFIPYVLVLGKMLGDGEVSWTLALCVSNQLMIVADAWSIYRGQVREREEVKWRWGS